MEEIKKMLLGITIILMTIILHLFVTDGLSTDLIAIVGLSIVILGYHQKDDGQQSSN